MRSNILITGGRGYVGSALVRRLVEDGRHRVTVVDNQLTSDDGADVAGVTYVTADVRDCGSWADLLADVDSVVHLAAVVGDPACGLDPQLAWEVNYLGTVRLVEECRRAGVGRFVFASTCSNYGISADGAADISSPLYPQSEYAASKIQAEHHLLVNQDEHFVPYVLRFATLYGLAPRMRFDLAINVMTANAARNGVVTVHGGQQWRPFLHVRDAAKAIHLTLGHQAQPGTPQIYNCGSPADCHQLLGIARTIAEEVPGSALLIQEANGDTRDYRVNFDRIRDEIGFVPDLHVVDGIREIRDALEAGHYQDPADARYSDHLSVAASLRRGEPASSRRTDHIWPELHLSTVTA